MIRQRGEWGRGDAWEQISIKSNKSGISIQWGKMTYEINDAGTASYLSGRKLNPLPKFAAYTKVCNSSGIYLNVKQKKL